MSGSRVVTRYVKSLLGLAEEQQSLEKVHRDMQLFSTVCDQNRAFTVMLRSPVIRHDKKRQILTKVFKDKVEVLTLAFFDIITKKNREPLLPEISKEFHNAYNIYKGIGKATLTTAFPIDSQLRGEIEKIVKEISDRKLIELDEKVNAELIGGFVLTVGDRQIDASIKTKLKILNINFSENPYVREL